MDDALIVRLFERLYNLSCDFESLIDGKGTAFQTLGQIFADNELDHEKGLTLETDTTSELESSQ